MRDAMVQPATTAQIAAFAAQKGIAAEKAAAEAAAMTVEDVQQE